MYTVEHTDEDNQVTTKRFLDEEEAARYAVYTNGTLFFIEEDNPDGTTTFKIMDKERL